MDVIGAVMPHRPQVEPLQDAQRLQIHRALAPGAAGVNLEALVIDRRRRFHPDAEPRQVVHGEKPALFLDEPGHFPGDFAAVKEIPRRLEGPLAPQRRVIPLYGDEPPESPRQIRLPQHFADRRTPPAGEKGRRGGGPAADAIGIANQRIGQPPDGRLQGGRDGESVLGQFQGRRNRLLEGHRAIQAQGGKPGIAGRRRHRPQHAGRQIAVVLPLEVINAGGLRPPPQAADGHRFAPSGVVNNNGRHAPETGPLRQGDIDGDAGRNACIGGVAARFQDPKPRRGGQVMPGGDHVTRPRN